MESYYKTQEKIKKDAAFNSIVTHFGSTKCVNLIYYENKVYSLTPDDVDQIKRQVSGKPPKDSIEQGICRSAILTRNKIERDYGFASILSRDGCLEGKSVFYYDGSCYIVTPMLVRDAQSIIMKKEKESRKNNADVVPELIKWNKFTKFIEENGSIYGDVLLNYQGIDYLVTAEDTKKARLLKDSSIDESKNDEVEGDDKMINEKEETVKRKQICSDEFVEKPTKESKSGFCYIMSNPAMPGLYKIGETELHPEQRAKKLYEGSGVPAEFEVIAAEYVEDCKALENKMHALFNDQRVNPRREFFTVDINEAVDTLHRESKNFMKF